MDKSILVVAVRGWTTSGDWLLFGRPGGELREEFVAPLMADMPDSEVWAPDLDMGMFSMRLAESLSQELFRKVDEKVRAMPGVERIVILGYSTGSVLARRLFCLAHGAAEDGSLSLPPAAWAGKIDRVVMLAGITRGWEFSSASPARVRFFGPVLLAVGRVVGFLRRGARPIESRVPLVWQVKRGSPFIVCTRIQYINVFEALRERASGSNQSPLRVDGLPSTVFLLGAKDEFMSPADCTELGPRSEFGFIELHGSNHADAVRITGGTEAAQERRRRLVAAISRDFTSLNQEPWAVPAADIDDYLDPMDIVGAAESGPLRGAEVEHAVMIVHGIRDNGFWTKRVAREMKTLARKAGVQIRAPTPTYGYFSMWDFVRPGGREQATFWFMERYADVKSHFPHAKVSFVGHSNGTYIAAHALEICPAIRLHHVVFAGSVVRRDFRWSRFGGRVRGVLNYVGSGDSVVAFLPAVFEFLRFRWLDVGGAGAFGFREAEPPPARNKRLAHTGGSHVELSEVRFVQGGHGAAIGEQFWPEIAAFVLQGAVPERQPVVRSRKTRFLFQCAPAVTAFGIGLAAVLLTSPVWLVAITAGWTAMHLASAETAMAMGAIAVASLFASWLGGRFLRMW